jgi:transcriptional regulator with XRE-family HTH domain
MPNLAGMSVASPPSRQVANGHAIKAIRESRGFNCSQLAAKVGISAPYMHRIENNQRLASPAVLVRIAAVLGVPFEAVTTRRTPRYLG